MLLLAPDPRLGLAPDRIARIRALLDEGATPGASGPGVAVALPGGADGVLDALVLRPDGVLGLVPAATRSAARRREPVGALGAGPLGETGPLDAVRPDADPADRARHGADGSAGPDPSGPESADPSDSDRADAEVDRLLALPDPPCAAPRRVLTLDAAGTGGGVDATTREALTAAVGSFRVLGVADVRRMLVALRLADHVPSDRDLADAGFLDEHAIPAARSAPSIPPVTTTGSSPSAPSAQRFAGTPSSPAAASSSASSSAAGAPFPAPRESDAQAVPHTEPVPIVPRTDDRPVLPSTGRLPVAGEYGSSRRAAPGRSRRGSTRSSWTVPAWVWSWRGLALAAAVAFLVALGVAALMVRGSSSPSTTTPVAADPTSTRVVSGATFTRRAVTSDTTCDGHAYGQAAQFLRERGCLRLDRTLWTGDVGGRAVVVAVAAVQMPDGPSAGALTSLVDTQGTGNIADLLREGRGYPGSPGGLTNAGYASQQTADRVVITEADWIDPTLRDENALDGISRDALALG